MTSTTIAAPTDADAALKQKHRTMWASGHYDRVAREIIPTLGERLVASLGITPGERVLDIATGTGNAAVPAARAGARVVASDLTPELLAIGRAEHPDADIDWQVADAALAAAAAARPGRRDHPRGVRRGGALPPDAGRRGAAPGGRGLGHLGHALDPRPRRS